MKATFRKFIAFVAVFLTVFSNGFTTLSATIANACYGGFTVTKTDSTTGAQIKFNGMKLTYETTDADIKWEKSGGTEVPKISNAKSTSSSVKSLSSNNTQESFTVGAPDNRNLRLIKIYESTPPSGYVLNNSTVYYYYISTDNKTNDKKQDLSYGGNTYKWLTDKYAGISFSNAPVPGSVTVTKEMQIGFAEAGDKFSFTLAGGSYSVTQEITWGSASNQTTFTNVPYGEYTLTENLPNGSVYEYQTTVAKSGTTIQSGKIVVNGDENVTVKNSRKRGASLEVTKLIGTGYALPTESFSFTLTGPNGYNETNIINWDASDNDNNKTKFNNLFYGKYTLTENLPDGSSFSLGDIVVADGTDLDNGKIVVNGDEKVRVTNNRKTGSLEVTKQMGPGSYAKAGDVFTFRLTGKDYDQTKEIKWDANDATKNKVLFEGLFHGTYTLTETLPTGMVYEFGNITAGPGTSFTGGSVVNGKNIVVNGDEKVNVTNNRKKGSITITKKLVSGTPSHGTTFTFQLKKGGQPYPDAAQSVKSFNWSNTSSSNKVEFKNLPYDDDYTVEEINLPTGYVANGVYFTAGSDTDYNARKITVNGNESLECVNSKPGSIELTKTFSLGHDAYPVSFQLYKGATAIGAPKTMTAANQKLTWTGLFMANDYSIVETSADGNYVVTYAAGAGTTITNGKIVVDGDEKVVCDNARKTTGKITVNKSYTSGFAPASATLTFQLLKDGNPVAGQLQSMNFPTQTSVTFTGLLFDDNYSVVEVNADGSFTPVYDPATVALDNTASQATINVTNVRNKGSVTVTKSYTAGYAPEAATLTFRLMKGSTMVEEKTLNWTSANTSVTFNDIYYDTGYSVAEVNPDGSTTPVIDPVTFDVNSATAVPVSVTNERKKGSLTVTKAFVGSEPASPTPITFELHQNGAKIAEKTITWPTEKTATFTDLYYDNNYSVVEIIGSTLYGYTVSIAANAGTDLSNDGIITVNGESEGVTVTNTARTASIEIAKALEQGSTAPDGTTFPVTVTNVNDATDTHTVNLPADGTAKTIDSLTYGATYAVSEDLSGMTGYALVGITQTGGSLTFDNGQFTVTDTDNQGTLNLALTVTNKQLGQVTIVKDVPNYDYNEGDTIPTFKFLLRLTSDVGVADLYIDVPADDPNGVTVNGLAYGNYTLTEVGPNALEGYTYPAGYTYDSNVYTFTVDGTAKNAGSFTFQNNGIGSVEILKLDSRSTEENLIPVPGTTFGLFAVENEPNDPTPRAESTPALPLMTGLTGDNGRLTFSDLPIGDYYIAEILQAPGYNIFPDDKRFFSITTPGQFVSLVEQPFVNDPIGRIEVTKTDNVFDKAMADIKIGLYATEAAAIADNANDGTGSLEVLTTDANGKAVSGDLILTGEQTTFYLKELSEPAGYVVDHTVRPVTINLADRLNEDNILIPTAAAITDTPRGNLQIIKADSLTNAPLTGAAFSLYTGMEGTTPTGLIASATTGTDGKALFTDLAPGSYWLVEDTAPEGYLALGAPINVKVEPQKTSENTIAVDDKGVWLSTVTILNTANPPEGLETGDLLLIKTDSLTGARLAGATFALYDMDMNLVDEQKTDSKGQIVFEGLDPETNYWLVETKAPKNYELNDTPVPVIVKSGDVKTINLLNTYNPPEDIQTGMMDYNLMILGGLGLLGGVLLVLFTRKRKTQKSK